VIGDRLDDAPINSELVGCIYVDRGKRADQVASHLGPVHEHDLGPILREVATRTTLLPSRWSHLPRGQLGCRTACSQDARRNEDAQLRRQPMVLAEVAQPTSTSVRRRANTKRH
jgi:hypothetical protein